MDVIYSLSSIIKSPVIRPVIHPAIRPVTRQGDPKFNPKTLAPANNLDKSNMVSKKSIDTLEKNVYSNLDGGLSKA